ncbi:MAG TPA: hypothetical protein VHA05_03465 [Candidatus Saccharimonadales bacterium]|jgi:hypothetical protein|nr:hypothetical protein [Candidatus Saccharimonadales bacterium]
MLKTKTNQKGFAAVEAILIVVIIAIVAGTGYYVYHTNKKSSDTLDTSSKVAQSSPGKVTKKKTTANTNRDAILAAIKVYETSKGASANTTYTIGAIVGSNARGEVQPASGDPSDYIAHNSNGSWQIVYSGHLPPGKAIGTQYGLPTSWYASNR